MGYLARAGRLHARAAGKTLVLFAFTRDLAPGATLNDDVFIAVGELALFIALVDRWEPRSTTAAWTVTLIGLGVSAIAVASAAAR